MLLFIHMLRCGPMLLLLAFATAYALETEMCSSEECASDDVSLLQVKPTRHKKKWPWLWSRPVEQRHVYVAPTYPLHRYLADGSNVVDKDVSQGIVKHQLAEEASDALQRQVLQRNVELQQRSNEAHQDIKTRLYATEHGIRSDEVSDLRAIDRKEQADIDIARRLGKEEREDILRRYDMDVKAVREHAKKELEDAHALMRQRELVIKTAAAKSQAEIAAHQAVEEAAVRLGAADAVAGVKLQENVANLANTQGAAVTAAAVEAEAINARSEHEKGWAGWTKQKELEGAVKDAVDTTIAAHEERHPVEYGIRPDTVVVHKAVPVVPHVVHYQQPPHVVVHQDHHVVVPPPAGTYVAANGAPYTVPYSYSYPDLYQQGGVVVHTPTGPKVTTPVEDLYHPYPVVSHAPATDLWNTPVVHTPVTTPVGDVNHVVVQTPAVPYVASAAPIQEVS
eukprot:gnl/TRDRNA2_/TRDRNA2_184899_c0_seq1.p1 gnl/TRDRNA2_/TRDRNA2_184899_c0~~gnl/TRDRNA2_/TRDRNA2_184899_c0_seq1.p1  ORF type:complete len:451 (-),score=72.41 gnl/TRDRNA2_/TRDRNA2_184899_c0_seq1:119-1471(-)